MTELNLSMFRAYDIRTPAKNLSLELAERLAEVGVVPPPPNPPSGVDDRT